MIKITHKLFISYSTMTPRSRLESRAAVPERAMSPAAGLCLRCSRPEQLARSKPGRRNRRRIREFGGGYTNSRVIEMYERWDQKDDAFWTDHVDFRCQKLEIRFFVGRVCLVNHATKGTWVRSIECLRNRLAQRTAF